MLTFFGARPNKQCGIATVGQYEENETQHKINSCRYAYSSGGINNYTAIELATNKWHTDTETLRKFHPAERRRPATEQSK